MRKKQSFEIESSEYFLLVEEIQNGEFWLRHIHDPDVENDGYYEEEVYAPISVKLKEGDNLAGQLLVQLGEFGFVLEGYRKLSCFTALAYSYIDETPGTKKESVCLHVRADLSKDFNSKSLARVSAYEILHYLGLTSPVDQAVIYGVSRLLAENSFGGQIRG